MSRVDAGPPQIGTRRHTLLVAETEQQRRTSAAAWVERALAVGEKVYYKGWHDPAGAPERHWLAVEGVRAAPEALRSGQLELLDYDELFARSGGTNEGIWRIQTEELERARAEGWASVAMAHDTFHPPVAEPGEVAKYGRLEAGLDEFMAQWPLRVLCQLTVADESDLAAWEIVAAHHRDLVDGPWSAGAVEGIWQPRGEIDAYVARRFGAAVVGAMRLAVQRSAGDGGPDLHVDFSEVEFIDVSAVKMLLLAARSAPAGQRVVLHGVPRMLGRLIDAIGRPDAVVDGDGGRRR